MGWKRIGSSYITDRITEKCGTGMALSWFRGRWLSCWRRPLLGGCDWFGSITIQPRRELGEKGLEYLR